MSGRELLEVENVSKTYTSRSLSSLLRLRPAERTVALRDVSFSLRAGEVTALLGPNGAGKTTLINILCDLTRPDGGRVSVDGLAIPAQGREARRRVGYASTNDRSFFWRLSGRLNLEFFAALQGYDAAESRRRAQEMLARFDLAAHAERLFHTYSAGMKKRLGLARAFLHDPAVLLLDESTSGLDARSTEELLVMVRQQIAVSRKTVLWATHRADEIERLCDRVVVLIGGRVCYQGSAQAFIDISRRHMGFTIDALAPPHGSAAGLAAAAAALGLATGPAGPEGSVGLVGTGDEVHLSAVLGRLIAAGARIRQVERHAEPLHKVFAHLEEREPGAAAGAPRAGREAGRPSHA